jgi:hypothetical protein
MVDRIEEDNNSEYDSEFAESNISDDEEDKQMPEELHCQEVAEEETSSSNGSLNNMTIDEFKSDRESKLRERNLKKYTLKAHEMDLKQDIWGGKGNTVRFQQRDVRDISGSPSFNLFRGEQNDEQRFG